MAEDESNITDGDKFQATMLHFARNWGQVIIEAVKCGACGDEGFCFHNFAEVLNCPSCNARIASRVKRQPGKGEVTHEHLIEALARIDQANAKDQKQGLPPIPEDQLLKCDPKTKTYLARHALQVTRTAMRTVAVVAQELAEQGTGG